MEWKRTHFQREKPKIHRVHLPFLLGKQPLLFVSINLEPLKTHHIFLCFPFPATFSAQRRRGRKGRNRGGGGACHEGPYLVAIGTGLDGPGESGQRSVTGKRYVETRDQEFDCLNLHGFFDVSEQNGFKSIFDC